MRDGRGDLGLDEVLPKPGWSDPGPWVPSLRPEVIAELNHVASPPAVIAAHDHAALLMPVEQRV